MCFHTSSRPELTSALTSRNQLILGQLQTIPDTSTEWHPSSFTRPTAPPYPDFSLTHTTPLPYRPFRYGPNYAITMGIRRMPWDRWIELDNEYPRYHALRASRLASRGDRCVRTAPEAFDAACELLEELSSYLCERYPTLYKKTSEGSLKNLLSGEEIPISEQPLREDPMALCARLVQDDLAIMIEKPDGKHYLLAGAILLAGFWRLEDKFGMSLAEIHESGDVPGFREKLKTGMERFFGRLCVDAPVERNNYFVQVDEGLAWSKSIGSEDDGGTWDTVSDDFQSCVLESQLMHVVG